MESNQNQCPLLFTSPLTGLYCPSMELQPEPQSEGILRKLFDIGIIIKGIDGVLEFIGGILFLIVSHDALNDLVGTLTQHELDQDPNDHIANAIVNYVAALPDGTKIFGSLYLILHGLVKIGMVWGLWRDKLMAYPISIGVISLFIVYQTYRIIFLHFSWPLLVFTVLDSIIILLIYHEWNYHHGKLHAKLMAEAAEQK